MVDLGSAPQTLASWQVCPWSVELFLPPWGVELLLTGSPWLPLLGWWVTFFPLGFSHLGSALDELFIKTLDTD